MNVAIFGATGRTGRTVLELVLNKGGAVRALVRDPAKLTLRHPLLTVVTGDATNEAEVRQTLEGVDSVIIAAGPVKGGHPELMTRLSRFVASAARSRKQLRVVWLTGAGVKLEGDRVDPIRSIVRGIMKVVAGAVLKDSEAGVRTVLDLGPQATVVRVPMLSDEATKGRLFLSDQPSRPIPAGRREVAQLLVEQLDDASWAGRAPFVGVQ